MTVSVEVKGGKKLLANLAKLRRSYPDALSAALYQEGLAVDAEAVKRVPVDTGILKNSHYVAPPTEFATGVRVEVGFGTKYAIHVHNRSDQNHTVGERLFLWNAFRLRMAGWKKRLAKRTEHNRAMGITAKAIPAIAPTRPKVPKDITAARGAARRKKRGRQRDGQGRSV
jgi:hypothetical protein